MPMMLPAVLWMRDRLREPEEAKVLDWCRAEEEKEEREKQLVAARGGKSQQQQRGGGGGGRGGAKKGLGPVVVCLVGEPNVSVGDSVDMCS